MNGEGNGSISLKAATSIVVAAWPVLAGLVLCLIGYMEVRGDAKTGRAMVELEAKMATMYVTRAETDARRSETDRRLDDASSNDRVLADRLSRIEATLQQLQVSVEAIRQRQEDDRRANNSNRR